MRCIRLYIENIKKAKRIVLFADGAETLPPYSYNNMFVLLELKLVYPWGSMSKYLRWKFVVSLLAPIRVCLIT